MSPISIFFNRFHHHRRCCNLSPYLRKYISTCSQSEPIEVNLSHPIYMIWGSNTGVGKTLVSTGLANSVLSIPNSNHFNYIKPVQTGFPTDSDSRFVYNKVLEIFTQKKLLINLFAENHALRGSVSVAKEFFGFEIENCDGGLRELCWNEEKRIGGDVQEGRDFTSKLVCKMLYGWKEAISPHLAAERENAFVEDSLLLESLQKCLMYGVGDEVGVDKDLWTIIETAGGVASPGPSGTLQCDLYRPFRLPVVLVGDGRLGGISGTISAYESLKLRGYDIVAVILEDNGLINEVPLITYLQNRVPVLVLPSVPQDESNNLIEWFDESQDVFHSLKERMLDAHQQRVCRLQEMPKKARDIFWWPFTQHNLVPEETVTVIDSRLGENFAVHKIRKCEYITQQFDACASWWTQGPDATLQIELAREMGYATARYGHVMFPENAYEPALRCAELLLEGVGRGWASRTFFSDNGSTAIEIALKMAFRKFSYDHGVLKFPDENAVDKSFEFKVLALSGSYHGDTLGAMEVQAPSSYTGFLQQPWYRGRGLFLDPPTIFISSGCWDISLPKGLQSIKLKLEDTTFSSQSELFSESRESSDLAQSYSTYISQQLLLFSESEFSHLGALIIEPVIHAAGGMHMVDPLFQRLLVKECRSRKIPVIFDEVFTGFWRLGVESAAELLGCLPDIACFGKLMSGGVIPLAATLATESVFDAFKGDTKHMALLHGHSYSAHAMGCTAATKAIQWFKDPVRNRNINAEEKKLRELWDAKLVHEISSHPAVERVVALGTLIAIELCTEGNDTGYGSVYATSLVRKLREDGVYMRPLGNVVYLMCGPCTSPNVCSQLLRKLHREIDEFSRIKAKRLRSCSVELAHKTDLPTASVTTIALLLNG
ncbi:Adenosylmethionine-8-amino-7-oxononanoate aminotransferase [Thalictrum thalictroides]|uniref:Adenosylmethionine-8-amino-7-oxononanoate aminotransferase n=1 Tax=Thalictrum thalictroides TaxID=46969 RepID=A0A7J6VGS6_THATH|nr:Adenosylmethionine-8-amino-7-oxononanoate aminotransferase [Thalictrum thalictroides]